MTILAEASEQNGNITASLVALFEALLRPNARHPMSACFPCKGGGMVAFTERVDAHAAAPGIWGLGIGAWDLGCGVWDLGSGIGGLRSGV